MFFRIQHESLYRYDVPVQLGAHTLRLTPRTGAARLMYRELAVEPRPLEQLDGIDAFGNSVTHLAFGASTRSLRIDSRVELETLAPPALEPLAARLPLARPQDTELALYIGGGVHPDVARFAAALAGDARGEPVAFLDRLTHALYERTDRHIRPSGNAREAHETLALRSGACRDLTVLFIAACHAQGLAARFVSGYQAAAQTPDGQHHLHAWAEVMLPGVGFRGWDPTHGVRVGDGHVALCAAPEQAATMPVEGGFFFQGPTVNSTLDHSVRITTR